MAFCICSYARVSAPTDPKQAHCGISTCVRLKSVCECSALHFSVCYTWRFAPKANKSVMPGIRPWPLLKLHRQAERLINQTASHRCDGFHTNRQQTVKVTSNRVNCQPGRQAPLSCSRRSFSSPLLYLSLTLPVPPFTSSMMPRCDTSQIFVLSL